MCFQGVFLRIMSMFFIGFLTKLRILNLFIVKSLYSSCNSHCHSRLVTKTCVKFVTELLILIWDGATENIFKCYLEIHNFFSLSVSCEKLPPRERHDVYAISFLKKQTNTIVQKYVVLGFVAPLYAWCKLH